MDGASFYLSNHTGKQLKYKYDKKAKYFFYTSDIFDIFDYSIDAVNWNMDGCYI